MYRKYICLLPVNPVLASWIRFHNPGFTILAWVSHACWASFSFSLVKLLFPSLCGFFMEKKVGWKWGCLFRHREGQIVFFSSIKKYDFELDNGWIHFSSFLRQNLFFASWLALGDVHNLSRLKDGRGCTLRTLCCEIKYFVHTQFRLPKDGVTLCVHCELWNKVLLATLTFLLTCGI